MLQNCLKSLLFIILGSLLPDRTFKSPALPIGQ